MRLAVDMGGTFTDLVVEGTDGLSHLHKAATVADDPVRGILECIDLAAGDLGMSRRDLLSNAELFVHGTTRGLNAILTSTTAKTAFLTTAGHRDILLFREGGRTQPFNHRREYPPPYVPRHLTYEVRERVSSSGRVSTPLDEEDAISVIARLARDEVEAVGICLLWSVINPVHEQRLGELLDRYLPGVPYTLSHRLNPSIREYRRASSACIDASLKPVMSRYLDELDTKLRSEGFHGRLLIVSSAGGVLDVQEVRDAPIHSLGSGPAMAPVAGRHYAAREELVTGSVVITDTGGTSFDVSLVRNGSIPWTRETWIGEEYTGDITGFPSVDVKSIGAGGGSIAWIDDGGLLRVGPQSAGARPGPACYGRGGQAPTVTDACVTLGFLDPAYFLGGAVKLDPVAARDALCRDIGNPLGVDAVAAAWAVLAVATEEMVKAIEETTIFRGVDPVGSLLIGGGGAAGFNTVLIARRLGCRAVMVPELGPGLSAAGALLSDLISDHVAALPTSTEDFAFDAVNAVLRDLTVRCDAFSSTGRVDPDQISIEFFAEARYPDQVWELEVPLVGGHFESDADVQQLSETFHTAHGQVFGVADSESSVEVVSWRARVTCRLGRVTPMSGDNHGPSGTPRVRRAFFGDHGWAEVSVWDFAALNTDAVVRGPALIEAPQTTVVVYPGASARRSPAGNLIVDPIGSLEEGASK